MSVETAASFDMTERARVETLSFLVHCGVPGSGEDFFHSLARYLAKTLRMDYVCIDRLEEGLLAAQTVAVYFDGNFEDNLSYTLRDTPCGDVLGKAVCVFPKNVRHLFPRDAVLQSMAAESYVGTTLWDSHGRPIGLIALVGRKPLEEPAFASSLLHLVAVRAASELERRQAENALRASEAALHRANLDLTAAIEKLRCTGEELARANLELRTSNERLEARVEERTAALRRRTLQLRALTVELTRAEEKERRRVADVVHDQLQQLLAAARIEVELLARRNRSSADADGLRKLDQRLAECLLVARSLTAELVPASLYRSGLAAALRSLGQWQADGHGFTVDVSVEDEVDVADEEIRVTLFSAVRELLFNAAKHAGVSAARVHASRGEHAVRVEVHDDGVGFDPAEARVPEGVSSGFGLFRMRERLEALGGSLTIDSAPGRGTHVTLEAPLAGECSPDPSRRRS